MHEIPFGDFCRKTGQYNKKVKSRVSFRNFAKVNRVSLFNMLVIFRVRNK